MLPQQLEASLKKSAELLRLTENDRDKWKATALSVTKELGQMKTAWAEATERNQRYADKISILSNGLREMAEQLES